LPVAGIGIGAGAVLCLVGDDLPDEVDGGVILVAVSFFFRVDDDVLELGVGFGKQDGELLQGIFF
jgi:hypothetical protein